MKKKSYFEKLDGKTKMIYGAVLIVIVVIGVLLILPSIESSSLDEVSTSEKSSQALSSEEILGIVQPEIDIYCLGLTDDAFYDKSPLCDDVEYVYVSDLNLGAKDIHKYTVEDQDEISLIKVQLRLVNDVRDRFGKVVLSFKVDKKGDITWQYLADAGIL